MPMAVSPFRTLRQRVSVPGTILTPPNNALTMQPQLLSSRKNHRGRSWTHFAENDAFRMTPENPNRTSYTMTDKSVFPSEDALTAPLSPSAADSDDNSTVSSLSNDSTRHMIRTSSPEQHANKSPPSEITVRFSFIATEESGMTAVPVKPKNAGHLNWQTTWVEGGSGAQRTNACKKMFRRTSSSLLRPSPVVTTSSSHDVAPEAKDRPKAPKHEHFPVPSCDWIKSSTPSPHQRSLYTYKKQVPEVASIPKTPPQDGNKNLANGDALVSQKASTPLSTSYLRRVYTDTTYMSSEAMSAGPINTSRDLPTINTFVSRPVVMTRATTTTSSSPVPVSPFDTRRSRLATTRESLVFRPLMKRANTTTNTTCATAFPSSSSRTFISLQQRHYSTGKTVINESSSSLSTVVPPLLGDRPRRKDIRGSTTVISFGTIVGQSSLVLPTTAAPTSPPSETGNNSPGNAKQFAQLTKANDRLRQQVILDQETVFISAAERRRRSALQSDVEFYWKQVRRWTGTEERLDLLRNRSGCLT